MQTYVINLAQRTDRMALMDAQLNALNMPYERIDAVNGLGDADIGHPEDHPILSKAEFACYLSHVKLWQTFVDSGEDHCLVLEDDLVLADDLPQIIDHQPFLDLKKSVIRLETHPWTSRTAKFPSARLNKRRLYRLFDFESGSGALILHRDFALFLLEKHSVPFYPSDHILNDVKKNKFPKYGIYILDPVPASQRLRLPEGAEGYDPDSDLVVTRRDMPEPDLKNLAQKVMHAFLVQPFRNIRHNLFRSRRNVGFSKD